MSIDQFGNTAFWDPGRYGGIISERANLTRAWLPADVHSVLDVGCGNGVLTNRLSDIDHVVGVDRYYAPLTQVQTLRAQSDILDLPFAAGAFDAVIAAEVIEHMPNSVYRQALCELARVARRYVLITVPYQERLWLENVRCPQCGHWFQMNGHMRSYDLPHLLNLYQDLTAFRPLRIQGIVPNNRPLLVKEALAAWRQIVNPSAAWIWFAVCPHCGYDSGAKASANASKPQSNGRSAGARRGIRRTLKRVWPRDRSPRWWAALYVNAR